MDFMAVSSYGNAAKSSGEVRVLKDLTNPIAGKHVIIAEDVLDSGLTLRYLMKELESRNPASLEIAMLLHKNTPRQADIDCSTLVLNVLMNLLWDMGWITQSVIETCPSSGY